MSSNLHLLPNVTDEKASDFNSLKSPTNPLSPEALEKAQQKFNSHFSPQLKDDPTPIKDDPTPTPDPEKPTWDDVRMQGVKNGISILDADLASQLALLKEAWANYK